MILCLIFFFADVESLPKRQNPPIAKGNYMSPLQKLKAWADSAISFFSKRTSMLALLRTHVNSLVLTSEVEVVKVISKAACGDDLRKTLFPMF